MSTYYLENKERIKRQAKEWAVAHPEKVKANSKTYYKTNRSDCLARVKANQKLHRERKDEVYQRRLVNKIEWHRRKLATGRKFLEDYKSTHPCSCGESNVHCLVFHHRNPLEKDMEVSQMLSKYSLTTLQKEVEKCDVLCANCHLKLHAIWRCIGTKSNRANGVRPVA